MKLRKRMEAAEQAAGRAVPACEGKKGAGQPNAEAIKQGKQQKQNENKHQDADCVRPLPLFWINQTGPPFGILYLAEWPCAWHIGF